MTIDSAWQAAFATQAQSDYSTFQLLNESEAEVDPCQALHYLQMCLEKLAKAHLYSERGTLPTTIRSSHNFIAKIIPKVFSQYLSQSQATRKRTIDPSLMKMVRLFCQEVDYLAPAVDGDGRRKDNCEYPWEVVDAGGAIVSIKVPCQHHFPLSDQMNDRRLYTFFKVLNRMIDTYT